LQVRGTRPVVLPVVLYQARLQGTTETHGHFTAVLRSHYPARHLFLGELGLDGALRHTTGILPLATLARERAIPIVYVPAIIRDRL
jgi:hypothetical protein